MDIKWTQNRSKMDQNGPKIDPKSTQNQPKINPKGTQNGPKIDLEVFF